MGAGDTRLLLPQTFHTFLCDVQSRKVAKYFALRPQILKRMCGNDPSINWCKNSTMKEMMLVRQANCWSVLHDIYKGTVTV